MQPAKNYDIHGNVKLRGKILDRVVTEGGFYSGQFGEIAYKSDLPPGGGLPFSFTAKETDSIPSYSNINLLSFNSNDFYLAHNNQNDDEVSIHLRDPNYNQVINHTGRFYHTRTLNETPFFSFTVPANTLDPGGSNFIRAEYVGMYHCKTTLQEFTWRIIVGGATVWGSDEDGLTASVAERPTAFTFHLTPRDSNSVAVWVHDYVVGSVTGQDHGFGTTGASPTITYQVFGNWYCNFNYGIDQEIQFTFDNTTTPGTPNTQLVSRETQYGKIELCKKQ